MSRESTLKHLIGPNFLFPPITTDSPLIGKKFQCQEGGDWSDFAKPGDVIELMVQDRDGDYWGYNPNMVPIWDEDPDPTEQVCVGRNLLSLKEVVDEAHTEG